MYESFVRSRGGFLHTYIGFPRLCQELGDRFNCCIKSLKIHKRECLYLLENPRKKESVVSEFAHGRVNKFSTGG